MLETTSFYTCVTKITCVWAQTTKIQSETDRIFCPFRSFFALLHPPTTKKIKILKKRGRHMEMSSFYTSVPKFMIMWCLVSEIWSATDIIFYHFGQIFALLSQYWPWKLKLEKTVKTPGDTSLFSHVYHKWRSYGVCFLRWGATERVFCHFGQFFALWPS